MKGDIYVYPCYVDTCSIDTTQHTYMVYTSQDCDPANCQDESKKLPFIRYTLHIESPHFFQDNTVPPETVPSIASSIAQQRAWTHPVVSFCKPIDVSNISAVKCSVEVYHAISEYVT